MAEFVVTSCAAHDAQTAQGALADKDLLRDACVAVKSLRNSIKLLSGCIAGWVAIVLCTKHEERRVLWQSLNVEMDSVEALSETLQAVFRDGRLFVASSCSSLDDLVGLVSTTMMSVWKFVKFNGVRALLHEFWWSREHSQFYRKTHKAVVFFWFARLTADMKHFLAP